MASAHRTARGPRPRDRRASADGRRVAEGIAERLIERPSEADAVMPLVGVALRSVREAERRPAIAAIARAAFAKASVRDAVTKHLPELELASP